MTHTCTGDDMTRPGIAHAFSSHLRHLAEIQRRAAKDGAREVLLQVLGQTREICARLTTALLERHDRGSLVDQNLDMIARLSPAAALWVDQVRGV